MRPTLSPFLADSEARDKPAGPQPMMTKSSISSDMSNSCKQKMRPNIQFS
jgi:hypothetical protein